MARRDAGAGVVGHIEELAVAAVPIEQARLLECLADAAAVEVGIDVAVGDDDILPAVVVEVEEADAPADVLGVDGEAGLGGDLGETNLAEVAVEVGDVAGEIGLDDVEPAVVIVIGGRGAHAGLLMAVLVIGDAGQGPALGEGAVVIVAEQQAGGGVGSHEDVGPAGVSEIAGEDGESGGAGGAEAGGAGDFGKVAVAVVVIQRDGFGRQAHRSTHDRETHPHALAGVAGLGGVGGVELEIVGDEEVEVAVAVVVEKGATGAPTEGTSETAYCGLVPKRPVTLVVPQRVVAPGGDEEIDVAVVVDIAGADALAPVGVGDAGFGSDVLEAQAAQVVIKEVGRRGGLRI